MADWEKALQAEADKCGLSLQAYIRINSTSDDDFDERRRVPARRLRGNKYVKFLEPKTE